MRDQNPPRPITIFTPSFADADITNAQALTVKEIVARLPADEFRVVMTCRSKPDPRIAARRNTKLLPYTNHGNTPRLLAGCLLSRPDIYFYPKAGPLDALIFALRKILLRRMAIVPHIVFEMNDATGVGLTARSIIEGDAVFANSDYVSKTVQQKFGVKATTIYNGINRLHFFTAAKSHAMPLTVLYAGSFQARKRVELVIREASRRPDVNFRLAGAGETQLACRELAQSLGCQNVSFLGALPQAELGDEMRKADIFLFPSILEGHPQVLGQAAACGLPVVAMNQYHPDYVIHSRTGFLVESDQELSECVDQLCRDPELRKKMSEAAVEHARKFDWDRIAGQWADVFRQLMANR